MARMLEYFTLGCRSHGTYKSLCIHLCQWQSQILHFYLNYHFAGNFRLALPKFRPHLAFCVSDAPTLLVTCTCTLTRLEYCALRNAQRTCQTSESVNKCKVNPLIPGISRHSACSSVVPCSHPYNFRRF